MSNVKIWEQDDFEIEFGIDLAEDCETETTSAYYTTTKGEKIEIVLISNIVKVDGRIVGKIIDKS